MQTFSLDAKAVSDVGLQREHNEDRAGAFPELGLFFVADGMGGMCSGDRAAGVVFDTLVELFERTHGQAQPSLPVEPDPTRCLQENRLNSAVTLSNRRVLDLVKTNRMFMGIGTTVAALSIQGSTAAIAHLGDSRVYRMRGGKLEALTSDHSLINEYKRFVPDVSPEVLAEVPKNVITRAGGMGDKVEVDTRHTDVQSGDVFLITTDGVHLLVSDEQLGGLLSESRNADECAQCVIDAALKNGGSDNASCVVVIVRQP
ncbi:MAG: serine/threonine-protein phosphatase [Polyangiaceae bacterium]|nr:serine/threonine-protein phosphatase [Polyangiaceae bacterium]